MSLNFELIELRNKYLNNPIIGYLNINSLRKTIIDLQEIMSKASIDIVCTDKTKLDESFPDSQFHMENYQFSPFWRDGGGKLIFVKNGLIAKRVKDLETRVSETICIELTILKKKWCIYLLINCLNKTMPCFSKKFQIYSLNQVVNKCENIFLAGDLNIGLLDSKSATRNHFSAPRDVYDLTNLVKVLTCYKNLKGTLLYVLLANRPNSFQKTILCGTGLSNCHMLITTILS